MSAVAVIAIAVIAINNSNKSSSYDKAIELYSMGQYEEALAAFNELEDYSDAANYEQAKGYYDSGDYEMAHRMFISLGSYEDSASYLSAIGESYYKKAYDLFEQKKYEQCGEMLAYIDTNEEWNEYLSVEELEKKASDAYIDIIREEAKNICRRDGYASMVEYITNAKCSILSEDVKYSDPMSNDALAGVESQITLKMSELSESVEKSDINIVKKCVREAQILLNERNKKCKLLK